MSVPINPPTEAENAAALEEFFAAQKADRHAVRAALPAAHAGLALLVNCCRNKTGQSYHCRSLLYSLWNGKPTRLVEIVTLDRALRDALLDVIFKWFLEEGETESPK